MNNAIEKKTEGGFIKGISIIIMLLKSIPFIAMAEDKDQEIFNQLYQEIINSSNTGNPGKTDSMSSIRKTQSSDQKTGLPKESVEDQATEQLRNEIEKIVKDAQLRHSDAVKFMQDE